MQKVKIALSIPGADPSGGYFAMPLKENARDERSEYRRAKNILLISNTRSNFTALYHILLRRQVLDKHLEWTFEDNHLIIISDGAQNDVWESEYLWFIYSLQQKAQRAGGEVHFILGGREVLNLQGAWRYAHPKYAVVKPGSKDPVTALYYGNNELWHWLYHKNIMEKIGPLLFVPGGISPMVNRLRASLSQINRFVRRHYTEAGQPHASREVELLLNSKDSPLNYSGYFDGSATKEQINKTLRKFGVRIIVTAYEGATPGVYCNGKVINITADPDNDGPAGLLIKRKHFYRLNHRCHRERIKL